jgi:hypothetical protein
MLADECRVWIALENKALEKRPVEVIALPFLNG